MKMGEGWEWVRKLACARAHAGDNGVEFISCHGWCGEVIKMQVQTRVCYSGHSLADEHMGL